MPLQLPTRSHFSSLRHGRGSNRTPCTARGRHSCPRLPCQLRSSSPRSSRRC